VSGGESARDRILDRIRDANHGRAAVTHPGSFGGWRREPTPPPPDLFASMFATAGGELHRVADVPEAEDWLRSFAESFDSVAVGLGVPPSLVPELPRTDASTASLALSASSGAVAETGSLILDARDGRRTQLLAPTHVVIVDAGRIFPTLRDAMVHFASDLPAAIGLHSGPSKSADIGQVMVEGVHGPGRLVALMLDDVSTGV
jgi:L-lactate dehydrogenase complex protein LldG